MKALQKILASSFNIDFRFSHEFSAERDRKRRAFICKACPDLKCLFGDVAVLADDLAINLRDEGRGLAGACARVPVPACDLLIAGVSCTDASPLNPKSVSMRSCVAERTGSTGQTFDGVYKYIAKVRPKFLILENVKNFDAKPPCQDQAKDEMAMSNMATAFRRLNRLGYTMKSFILQPFQYGEAQNRLRLWMVGSTSLADADMKTMEDLLARMQIPEAACLLLQLPQLSVTGGSCVSPVCGHVSANLVPIACAVQLANCAG